MRSVMICGVLLAAVASAAEQEPVSENAARRTFVGLVPVSLGQGMLAIDGEQVLRPKLSARVGLRFGLGVGKNMDGARTDNSYLQMGLEPGLRYYLTGTALDGLWVGSHLELSGRVVETVTNSLGGRATSRGLNWNLGVGTLVGYSMVVSRGLTIQAGVGLGADYSWDRLTVGNALGPEGLEERQIKFRSWGISGRATLAVGWAF